MKCPACQAEFTPPPGKNITGCPFCGESLSKPATGKKCETLVDALELALASYGRDMLLDGQRLVAFLHDYLPRGKSERNILKNAFALEIPAKLSDGCQKPLPERKMVMTRCVKLLVDDYAMAQAVVEEVLWDFAETLGWQDRPAPQPEAPAPPAPQPKASAPQAAPPQPASEPAPPPAPPRSFHIDRGYISPHLLTNVEDMEAVINDAYILITDKKISEVEEILGLLEQLAQYDKKLVIIADDLEGSALNTLILNHMRGTLIAAAFRAPGFGDRRNELRKDIAILTGARIISTEQGFSLEKVNLEDLGRARRVIVQRENSYILDGFGNPQAISDRIAALLKEMGETTSNYDWEKLKERLENLCNAIGTPIPALPSRPR